MKPLDFGQPDIYDGGPQVNQWVVNCFREIEKASREDMEQTLQVYTVDGSFTPVRELDMAGDLDHVKAVLATILTDIRKRGQKRTYAT